MVKNNLNKSRPNNAILDMFFNLRKRPEVIHGSSATDFKIMKLTNEPSKGKNTEISNSILITVSGAKGLNICFFVNFHNTHGNAL